MEQTLNSSLDIGTVLNDKWVILELIGKGGMGEVYRAHQLNLKRDVAIKIISQDFLESFNGDTEEMETTLGRFRREVQAMAQIRHANVLQIFDFGSTSFNKNGIDVSVEYIVMEYIPGATLRFTMPEEGFYPDQDRIKSWLVDYFLPLLDGVQAIHELNIAHRDLKPENVLLDGESPKIADFGLARSSHMKPVTQSVDIKGTVAYMSPEHFFDFKKADQRADIYSLGKILFEAIDGKITSDTMPFKRAKLSAPDTPLLQKLNRIIQAVTAEEKEDRVESVATLREALIDAIASLKTGTTPEPPATSAVLSRPKWIWTGIAVAMISILAMAIWHLTGEPGKSPGLSERTQISKGELLPPDRSRTSDLETESRSSPVPSIMGEDGIKMLLVAAGDLLVDSEDSERRGRTLKVPPFYMDAKEVTNHNFVEFLNNVKETIIVESGVVKKDGEIWFYLGEGIETHEQIIYRHDRFHLRDTKYAAQPVVRVTWYGAFAYARYYGKRLPTEYEWQYATREGIIRSGTSSGNTTDTFSYAENETGSRSNGHMMTMHGTNTEQSFKGRSASTNSFQASASDMSQVGRDVKEWVVRVKNDNGTRSIKGQAAYESLVLGKSSPPGSGMRTFRYPWEGFPDVGFRCALGIRGEN